MKILTKFGLLAAFILASSPLFADEYLDSAYKVDEFKYHFDTRDFNNTPFKSFDFIKYFESELSPRIDINYNNNITSINKDEYSKKFNNIPELEVKAGYVLDKRDRNGYSVKSSFDYIRFSHYNPSFGKAIDSNLSYLQGWQFGFGDYKGYGWSVVNGFDIVLSHGKNYNWHILTFEGQPAGYEFTNKLERFHDKFKFGTSFEAGVNIKLFNSLGINATYEQNQVLPAHQFWYWSASEIIEAIAKGFTNSFIQEITQRNSIAGPIINFVIKNGISYGMYELRKTKMNWPLSNEAPLAFEKFKIGISYSF